MSRAIMGKLLNVLVYVALFLSFLCIPSLRAFRLHIHLVGWLLLLPVLAAIVFGGSLLDSLTRRLFGTQITKHAVYLAFQRFLGMVALGAAFALGTLRFPAWYSASSTATAVIFFLMFGAAFALQEYIDERFK